MFFGVGSLDLITLAVLAALLFGPDKLPGLIQNAVRVMRKVREFSEGAEQEIRAELGPDFKDFEFEDLHPTTFVRKHVLDGGSLGLDEIRSACDPRAELEQVADAVRASVGDVHADVVNAGRVSLAKAAQPEPAACPSFDPDAT